MAYAEREDDRIVVRTEFVERELIKQVPGFKWATQAKHWHGPLSWGSCVALRGVFADRLQVGPLLAEWATVECTYRIDPCVALRGETAPLWPDTDVQRAITAWEDLRADADRPIDPK